MGLCFSKKQRREDRQGIAAKKGSGSGMVAGRGTAGPVPEVKKALQAKPAPNRKAPPKAEEQAAGTRTVFVVKAAAAAAAAEVAAAEANREEDEGVKKRSPPVAEAKPVVVSRVPVRTSSCTKEEVDAILIQCGRLSRSSSASGKAAASGESGGGHQRYSGSKRSYDFDRERRGGRDDDDCDWDRHGAAVSRPSPRRRTPERKRSWSHERGSGGGSGSRRVSRSPGRRADLAPATVSSVNAERAARQPGKMVSVPAREKGRAPSPVKPASSGKRYASPTLRSNSPARLAAVGNENAAVQQRYPSPTLRSNSPARLAAVGNENAAVQQRYPSPTLRSNSPARLAAVGNENAAAQQRYPSPTLRSNSPARPAAGGNENTAVQPRYPSPTLRSNSPARLVPVGNENVGSQPNQGPSLSRSSSRKAEHSPYRRNPMSELDENTLVNNHRNNTSNIGKYQKKSTESAVGVPPKLAEQANDQVPSCRITKDKPEIVDEAVVSDGKAPSARMNATHTVSIVSESVVNPRAGPGCRSARRSSCDFDHNGSSYAFLEEAMLSDTKAPSSRMNATHSVSIVTESVINPKTGPAGRSSRRSSRDFDHNGSSYASLLLEDIQNYHHQKTNDTPTAPAFVLPACVSKACSILEAVADLNSSSSENRSFELDRSANDKGSVNGSYSGKAAEGTLVVESEVTVKDDLMEPSFHKYVSVRDIRGGTEPQESAGSNSFASNPWTCSWEPNSVSSTDRTWTGSRSNSGEEAEQRSSGTVSTLEQSWQERIGSTTNAQRGRSAHLASSSVVSAQSDVRTISAGSSTA